MGDAAPPLPHGLESLSSREVPELAGRRHLLFFWATWCLPCKKAVPEVLAYAAAEGVPVLETYLEQREEVFFDEVAVDPLRKSFISGASAALRPFSSSTRRGPCDTARWAGTRRTGSPSRAGAPQDPEAGKAADLRLAPVDSGRAIDE